MQFLKIPKGSTETITIANDSPVMDGSGQFGNKYKWLVVHAGVEKEFTASETLNKKLQAYHKGDVVTISLKPLDGGKQFWDVKGGSQVKPPAHVPVAPQPSPAQEPPPRTLPPDLKPVINDRNSLDTQKDIHTQVALKLAVEAVGSFNILEGSITSDEYISSVSGMAVKFLDLIEGGLRHSYANYKNLNLEEGSGE